MLHEVGHGWGLDHPWETQVVSWDSVMNYSPAGYRLPRLYADDTAAVRANLIAMHMWHGSHTNANDIENFFVAGGVVSARLIRTDGHWKISQLSNVVVWRGGSFKNVMQTK